MCPRWAWLITTSRTPARASASIRRTISDFPRTSRRHFGIESESGRMRSPRPTARIIAFMVRSERVADALLRRPELVEQAGERRELAVALAGAPQVAHHQRLVLQVAVLAVPEREPREDPEHFQLALSSHPFEIAVEVGEVRGHRQLRGPGFLPVAHRPVDDLLLLPGDVGVAQQRDEVVGDGTIYGVLEIENARTGLAHHQVT